MSANVLNEFKCIKVIVYGLQGKSLLQCFILILIKYDVVLVFSVITYILIFCLLWFLVRIKLISSLLSIIWFWCFCDK